MQNILVLISFVIATGYLIYILFGIFIKKKDCDSCGSGSCSTIDFEKINDSLKEDKRFN